MTLTINDLITPLLMVVLIFFIIFYILNLYTRNFFMKAKQIVDIFILLAIVLICISCPPAGALIVITAIFIICFCYIFYHLEYPKDSFLIYLREVLLYNWLSKNNKKK